MTMIVKEIETEIEIFFIVLQLYQQQGERLMEVCRFTQR